MPTKRSLVIGTLAGFVAVGVFALLRRCDTCDIDETTTDMAAEAATLLQKALEASPWLNAEDFEITAEGSLVRWAKPADAIDGTVYPRDIKEDSAAVVREINAMVGHY